MVHIGKGAAAAHAFSIAFCVGTLVHPKDIVVVTRHQTKAILSARFLVGALVHPK